MYQEARAISVRRHDPTAPRFERAEGCYLVDSSGRSYFDASGGSGAVNLGHQRREIVETIQRQAAHLVHTGWNFDHPSRHGMIERLARLMPYPSASVMGAVTGAEAIEVALKIARACTARAEILYFENSFHGKTQGALAVTSNARFRAHLPQTVAAYPKLATPTHGTDIERAAEMRARLRELLAERDRGGNLPAAAVIEPIQAAEGIYPVPQAVLAALIEVCREYGVLTIFDEIYTGLGRTGSPFVAEAGLCPDLIVIGKSLGNGLPIAAVVGDPSVVDRLGYADHSSTFTFNPLACAVACTVLDIHLDERPWENAAAIGATITAGLHELARRDARLRDIRGRGLMLAFDVVDDVRGAALATRFTAALQEHGVLVRAGGRTGATIKLTPPLVMSRTQAAALLGAIGATLDQL